MNKKRTPRDSISPDDKARLALMLGGAVGGGIGGGIVMRKLLGKQIKDLMLKDWQQGVVGIKLPG